MTNAIHAAVLQACRNFMVPIARFLLRNGITFKEFAEVAKWAFVHVATEEYGVRGRKANISRVAVMTGLSRREVSKARSESAVGLAVEREWEVIGEVLRTWYTNPVFIDSRGNPAVLSYSGKGSFCDLVRLVTDEMLPETLLEILLGSRSVAQSETGDLQALSRYYIPSHPDVRAAYHFGMTLNHLATTLGVNYSPVSAASRFERFVWSDTLPTAKRARFQRLAADQSTRLLEVLDDWLSANEESGSPTDKIGLGIYLFDEGDGRLASAAAS